MERIYGRQDDMHTLAVVAYVHGNGTIYEDAEFTTPVTTKKLGEMFLIGLILKNEQGIMRPLGYGVVEGVGTVFCVMPGEEGLEPMQFKAVDPVE